MAYRGMRIASVVVVGLMALVAATALARLPAGATLPTHWNLNGAVDGRMGAGAALLVPVAVTALVSLVLAALPAIEPMQDRLAASAPLLRTAWAGTLALMLLVEVMVAAPAFGLAPPAMLPLVGAGLLLVAIGNALPKSRPGFFVGIRTPWTLVDPETWIATHRLGARTMIAAGALLVVAALLPADGVARGVLIGAAVLLCLVPLPYSWWYWQRTARR